MSSTTPAACLAYELRYGIHPGPRPRRHRYPHSPVPDLRTACAQAGPVRRSPVGSA